MGVVFRTVFGLGVAAAVDLAGMEENLLGGLALEEDLSLPEKSRTPTLLLTALGVLLLPLLMKMGFLKTWTCANKYVFFNLMPKLKEPLNFMLPKEKNNANS
ncbi:hypothetical protein RIF29_33893 [Crotalaria pallida]|uniref:Uncharacterized protein n=1 Tax=Crotalaria pallida TaxID=3830 RepID=A0AAN9E8C2_CROPI